MDVFILISRLAEDEVRKLGYKFTYRNTQMVVAVPRDDSKAFIELFGEMGYPCCYTTNNYIK